MTDCAIDFALDCILWRFGVSLTVSCEMRAGEGRPNPSLGVF